MFFISNSICNLWVIDGSINNFSFPVGITYGTIKDLANKVLSSNEITADLTVFSRSSERYYDCRNCYSNNFLVVDSEQVNFLDYSGLLSSKSQHKSTISAASPLLVSSLYSLNKQISWFLIIPDSWVCVPFSHWFSIQY